MRDNTLSADQVRFVDEVVNRLVANGILDREELADHPFINVHPHSIVGVFARSGQAHQLLAGIDAIKSRTLVQSS